MAEKTSAHSDIIRSVAFNNDGTKIVSGSDDHIIYILSLAHGSTICHGSRGDGYVPMPEMGIRWRIGVTGIGGLTRTSEPPMDPSQAYKLPTYPQSEDARSIPRLHRD